MQGLFRMSLEEKKPILIMYMNDERVITDRNIIVRKIHEDYIRAYCLKRNQLRTFKRENILAASKPKQKRGVRYA
ncbi:hypothetical protein NLX67_21770 [Domibacillus sp. A3M-37]|jgi:predicted DNA-binding transcriptional regulator YafY|uniref:hypothetical protein n=1 Tax=Domibacillus sp. A3M-37 TaxID=2962037 RepID=UPI0020B6FAF4|nr:hypothetical protein [Domibacillus sp. A3M-37]MCP3764945.1 hypothetical protein [Domibacillus sp. A3M-37]